MKRFLITLCVCICLVPTALWANVKVGSEAPDFNLMSTDGKAYSLSAFRGKKVILEWTNHECPFVKKHYNSKNMQGLQTKYTKDGVIWLSIISSADGKQGNISAEMAKQLTDTRDASPTYVLFDPTGHVGKQYGAKTTPQMYIIDEKGTLRYNGAIDSIPSVDKADIKDAENYVDTAMVLLSEGKPVKPAMTRPYGCSVKY